MLGKGYRVSLSGNEKCFKLECVVVVAHICEYTKNTELYTFKGELYWYVNYMSIKQIDKWG